MKKNKIKKFSSKPMHTVKSDPPTSWKKRLPAFILLAFMIFWTLGSVLAVWLSFDSKSNSSMISASAEGSEYSELREYIFPFYEVGSMVVHDDHFGDDYVSCGIPFFSVGSSGQIRFYWNWQTGFLTRPDGSVYMAPFSDSDYVYIDSYRYSGSASVPVMYDCINSSSAPSFDVAVSYSFSANSNIGGDTFPVSYTLRFSRIDTSSVAFRYDLVLRRVSDGALLTGNNYVQFRFDFAATSSYVQQGTVIIPWLGQTFPSSVGVTDRVLVAEAPVLQFWSTDTVSSAVFKGMGIQGYIDTINQLEKKLNLYQSDNLSLNNTVEMLENAVSDLRSQYNNLLLELDKQYSEGYNIGYDDGYADGYNGGIADSNEYSFTSLISAVVDVPIQTFTSLFNFDFLGVNLASFFLSLLTVAIILTIVKLFL